MDCGSQNPSRTAAPIAASTAFPPDSNNCKATFAANGVEVAHIPLAAKTVDRPFN